MKSYYVYFITNQSNEVLYIGFTNNLERRSFEHRNKLLEGFSKKYKLYKLVYYEEFADPATAINREKQLKKWRREKKDILVNQSNPNWLDLFDNFL